MDPVQAATFNFPGMMVARLFLGIFEAGFGPAIPLYFCKSFVDLDCVTLMDPP